MTTMERNQRGRPRAFETDDALERSLNVFWRRGFNNTTTRVLESELGITQSSLYNAFGSKEGLFEQVLGRYQQQLVEQVLVKLDRPDPDRQAILDFLTALVAWVSQPERPGCLVLNHAVETGDKTPVIEYRRRLRSLLRAAVRSFTPDKTELGHRTEMLVSAVMGLNISACGGASKAELKRLSAGIKHQINAWP